MQSWIPRLGGFTLVLLLAASLAFLQVLNAEKDLLSCLTAYAVIALGVLLAVLLKRSSFSPNLRPLLVTAVFVTYLILRALTSPAGYVARADLYCALAALVLYGLIAISLSGSAERIAFFFALLAFAVVHVFVSIVQAGFGENLIAFLSFEVVERSSRGTGLFVNPDHLAGALEVLGILGLSIACWSRWPRWSKVIVGYLTIISYLGLILTGSRGGYLSAIASLLVFAFLSIIVLRAGGTAILAKVGGSGFFLLAGVLLCAWFFIQQSPSLRGSAERIFTIDAGRLDLWRAALEQWKLRPLVGTGSGTYLFYGRQFRSEQMQLDPVDAHNDYLQLLCEYGLVGAVGFLLFFAFHLRHAWLSFLRLGPKRVAAGSVLLSDRLALNIGAFGALAAYVLHSAVDFNLHIPANALLIAFVFGLMANPGLNRDSGQSLVRPTKLPQLALGLLAALLLWQCLRLLPGELYADRARAALRDEDPVAAISFAKTALTYETQNPNIFFLLGRAQVALANKDEPSEPRASLLEKALPAFEEARRLVPLDGSYPMQIAFVYDQLGRFDEAEAMYQIARARDPRSDAVQQMYQSHLESWENQSRKE